MCCLSCAEFEIELEDDEHALWLRKDAVDERPDGPIHCPLEGYILRLPYSMPLAAEEAGVDAVEWEEEVEAHRKALVPTWSSKRKLGAAACGQRPYSVATIALWLRCQAEFVGFLVTHLGEQPSLAAVMHPQLVAKFFGYLQARAEEAGRPLDGLHNSIKKYCTAFTETVRFVTSPQFPGVHVWSKEHIKATTDWLANARNSSSVAIANRAPACVGMAYWQAICNIKKSWVAFVAKFKVCWCCWLMLLLADVAAGMLAGTADWCCWLLLTIKGQPYWMPTCWHCPTQANGEVWTVELAKDCQAVAVQYLLGGVDQPPLRLGALRVMMSSTSLGMPCVMESCK